MAIVPPSENNYTLGRGVLFFAPFLPGTQTPSGERDFGDVNSIDITFKTTDLDHYSSRAGVKELDQSITLQVDRTGSFTTENINSDNLALFFLGSASKITQSADTVTAEVTADVEPGLYYQLGATAENPVGNRGLDPATPIVVTGSISSPPTYVVEEDYTIDYDLGRLYIVPGGAITGGLSIKSTYDLLAGSRDAVISSNVPIEGQLRFIAFNPTGTDDDALMPWVRITPNSNLSLIGDKFTALQFDLKVLKKTSQNQEALYIDGRVAA
jgi:hypothetical protein